MSDDTWFWKIVDASGLEGVPSDEVEALSRIMDELRALRAALDAAERDARALQVNATSALSLAERMQAERDAALAARDAAWRAGRDAAAARSTATVERYGMMRYEWADGPVIARAIRTLQPPADLAAEAPGDEVAKEREAWQPLYEAAQNLAASLDGGFVACSHCGEQEATGDMDFVPEFLAAIRARAGA